MKSIYIIVAVLISFIIGVWLTVLVHSNTVQYEVITSWISAISTSIVGIVIPITFYWIKIGAVKRKDNRNAKLVDNIRKYIENKPSKNVNNSTLNILMNTLDVLEKFKIPFYKLKKLSEDYLGFIIEDDNSIVKLTKKYESVYEHRGLLFV